MIADDNNFHSGLGRSPFTKSSTNFLKRPAVEVRLTASLIRSHVNPSLWSADFFYMPTKASVTALFGIGTKVDLQAGGGAGTCVCIVDLVSLARKVAVTTGSDSVP